MIASLVLFLTIAVIPATPREVRVHLMDSHSVRVMWSTREQSQGHVTSYYIEYKVKNYDEVQLKVVQNQKITSLTGLQSHAVYEVRVRAVNGAGGGMWSHYETFSTGQTCKKKMKPFYLWVRLQNIPIFALVKLLVLRPWRKPARADVFLAVALTFAGSPKEKDSECFTVFLKWNFGFVDYKLFPFFALKLKRL